MATSARPRLTPLLALLALLLSVSSALAQGHTLLLSPDSLAFTATKLGTPVVKTFTITNQTSTVPIIVSVGQPDNPLFIVESEHQFTLAKGQTKTITISFTPSILGNFTATLPIENNAFDEPSPIEYKLSGEVRTGSSDSLGLVISPAPIGFGNVSVGAASTATLTIKNASIAHRYTGTVQGLAPPFIVESGGGAFDLAPGQSRNVALKFSPTAAGYYIDSLVVHGSTSDGSRPDTTVRILFAGRGTSGPVPSDSLSLIALPDSIDFGLGSPTSPMERSIVVTNRSQHDTITGVFNRTTSASFTLVRGGDFFKLNPGESRELTVQFLPMSAGTHTDSIVSSYATQDTAASSKTLVIMLRGSSISSGVDRAAIAGYTLGQNHPNPAVGSTTIELAIARTGNVRVRLYDVRGRLLGTLLDERLEAGSHALTIDAGALEPGVYLYRMESGEAVIARPMTVVR